MEERDNWRSLVRYTEETVSSHRSDTNSKDFGCATTTWSTELLAGVQSKIS